MLQQVTPAIVVTLCKEPGQGHVVKMDSGQTKNPAVRYVLYHLTCDLSDHIIILFRY